MRYDVDAGIYEGPLPLLVELSKHRLLDVFLIKIQELTAQYRAWMKTDSLTLNELAEPLPLLGQLLAVKAKQLLPAPPTPDEEEEAPLSLEELERRLREYEQFKSIAQVLAELHTLQHERLTRPGACGAAELPEVEGSDAPAPVTVGLIDLMSAFAKVLDQTKVPVYEVEQEAWTVEMKVKELRMTLTLKPRLSFHELFPAGKSTLELVVTFLALLELVRQRVCAAVQERHFDEILIVRRDPGSDLSPVASGTQEG